MKRQDKKPTPEEEMLRAALERHGLKVLYQLFDGYKHIDLAIPAAKINIDVDGRNHLTSTRQILADLRRSHYSSLLGYETIHIPNEYILADLEKIAAALAKAAAIRGQRIQQGLTP